MPERELVGTEATDQINSNDDVAFMQTNGSFLKNPANGRLNVKT